MRRHLLVVSLLSCFAASALAQDFSYMPPGQLVEGSGTGREDYTVYVPGMRFPIENAPAYANSQVWGNGGMYGPGGSQCDEVNYSYPWWDNYCETRSWDMPLCPTGEGHQGQDIRPATCEDDLHWAVAAEDGTITNIGTYSLYLEGESGTLHRYLHMEPSSIPLSVGDSVTRGQRVGRVSNAFGGTPTTIHLHYDINQYVAGYGNVYVPPYMSLVESYQELLGTEPESCDPLQREGGVIDDQSTCFRLHGPMSSWRYVADAGYDGTLYWTYAWDREQSNWAEWIIEPTQEGDYRLEVYTDGEYAQSRQALYTLGHAGEQQEVRLDQTAVDGWQSLGEFFFDTGDDQCLAVGDATGEDYDSRLQLVADAVRLTLIEEPVDDEPVADTPPDFSPDAGGDPESDPQGDWSLDDLLDSSLTPDAEPVDVREEGESDQSSGRFAQSPGSEGCGCRSRLTAGSAGSPLSTVWLVVFGLVWFASRRRWR